MQKGLMLLAILVLIYMMNKDKLKGIRKAYYERTSWFERELKKMLVRHKISEETWMQIFCSNVLVNENIFYQPPQNVKKMDN